MNIFSFSAHFTSEEDCRNHFKSERDKDWCDLLPLRFRFALLDKKLLEL